MRGSGRLRARMPGSTARMTESTAKKFRSNMRRTSASAMPSIDPYAVEVLLGGPYGPLGGLFVGDVHRTAGPTDEPGVHVRVPVLVPACGIVSANGRPSPEGRVNNAHRDGCRHIGDGRCRGAGPFSALCKLQIARSVVLGCCGYRAVTDSTVATCSGSTPDVSKECCRAPGMRSARHVS